jgi:predicted negative regulator of RcsB-dependent stress response
MDKEAAPLPLADRLWTWFETNKKQAIYGVIVLVGGGLIAGFVYWQQTEKEIKTGEAFSDVSEGQGGGVGPRPESADAFLRVAAKYPKSTAAQRAILFAATSYFLGNEYDKAKAQFDRFARENRESALLGDALLGSAACLDAQGKTEEAIAAYKNLVDHHGSDLVVPVAKLALGRLYEFQNKPELARTQYEEIVRNDPMRSSIGDDASMRLEELRVKYPPPAPPPSAMTPGAMTPILPGMVTNAPGIVLPKPSVMTTTSVSAPKVLTNAGQPVPSRPTTNATPFKLESH